LLKQQWLQSPPAVGQGADLNSDGVVDLGDLKVLADCYAGDVPTTAPEPGTLCLLALGNLAMLRRSRRGPSPAIGPAQRS
jgi:hypothetical protein